MLTGISHMTSFDYTAGPCSAIVQRPPVAPTTLRALFPVPGAFRGLSRGQTARDDPGNAMFLLMSAYEMFHSK